MAALETCLKEKAFDDITVTDIARTAGVSTGLLYAHFKNKADFLDALLEAYKARIIARLDIVESGDVADEYRNMEHLRDALRLIADFAYTQLLDDAHIIRAIAHRFRSHPQTDQADWQDLRDRASLTITPILDVFSGQIERTDRDRTAKMLVYFFNTIFADTLMFHTVGEHNTQGLNRAVFIDEITDMAYGYLTTAQMY